MRTPCCCCCTGGCVAVKSSCALSTRATICPSPPNLN
jgi:hypothetical protein